MKCWMYLALVVGLGLGAQAVGGEVPCQAANPWRCMRALLTGCPDDFCRKPCPRIGRLGPCGGPDDYCPKPCPRLWMLGYCNLPDDYGCKPCPDLCRPLPTDPYTCGYSGHCRPAAAAPGAPEGARQAGVPSSNVE